MSGNCSLRLKDYQSAIAAFRNALELQPGESHNEAGILEAYARAGMAKERDSEIANLARLKADGKLPQNFHFLFEVFPIQDKTVEVVEFYPDLSSGYHFRYWFNELNSEGKLEYRVALESDDIDQGSFAKQHPAEAAAGQRRFSMDGYGTNNHSTYRFFDGEPSYAEVKEQATKALSGRVSPASKTSLGAASPEATSNGQAPASNQPSQPK